jgi:hypothetical protein
LSNVFFTSLNCVFKLDQNGMLTSFSSLLADAFRNWCGAETNLLLADEFRDGNEPATYHGLAVAKAAYAALPSMLKEFYYRGDSACHEH